LLYQALNRQLWIYEKDINILRTRGVFFPSSPNVAPQKNDNNRKRAERFSFTNNSILVKPPLRVLQDSLGAKRAMTTTVDLLVVGGGVNGAGVARDAAGRGLSVMLCEKADLAQHTSSASTKLIHGGLRYLEQYEFRLVRESLIEREVLLHAAPHIIWPLRFVLPHHKGLRPGWLLRLGLFIYDHLGGRKILPPTKTVRFRGSKHDKILSSDLRYGFEYSDCWVDDARLVVLNALDAKERGADIRTRCQVVTLERRGAKWRVLIKNRNGHKEWVLAKAVVNAAGPWVDDVLNNAGASRRKKNVRLIKGSHIVTRRLFDGDHAYIFQHEDNRIVFAIPYERNFTLIGTTDVPYSSEDGPPSISDGEIDYLCALVSEYFKQKVTKADIVWTYSGVRPLFDSQEDNASVVTRDYVFDLDVVDGKAPLLSVFGGKITTCRKLAEQAVDSLEKFVTPLSPGAWTRDVKLPGGGIACGDFDSFFEDVCRDRPWAPRSVLHRLARAYGDRLDALLGDAACLSDLGEAFGADLYEIEARYLADKEFAQSADDVLWRRTKCGLRMSSEEINRFANWFAEHLHPGRVEAEKTRIQLASPFESSGSSKLSRVAT
jgi:glycerol-3-phosphate dehydrogenase